MTPLIPGPAIELELNEDISALAVALDRSPTAITLRFLSPTETFKKAARVLSACPRVGLHTLRLVDAEFTASAEVEKPLLTAKETAALWAALPNLVHLELRGHAWCTTINHPSLQTLMMDGYGFGLGGALQGKPIECPALEQLTWSFKGDAFGVAIDPAALKGGLWSAKGLPKLRDLDLLGADLDGALLECKAFMKSPLLAQLRRLVLPASSVDAATLKKLLPQLSHLEQIVVDDDELALLDARMSVVASAPVVLADLAEDYWAPGSLDDKGLTKLRLLERAGAPRSMSFPRHWLDSTGAQIVGELVARHPQLESFDIGDPAAVGWEHASLEAFQKAIGVHPSLKVLRLKGNCLTGAGAALAQLIGQLPALEVLDLNDVGLNAEDTALLVPALCRCTHLRELSVGSTDKSDVSAAAWAELQAPRLEKFVMWTTAFSTTGARMLLTRLGTRLPSLRWLDLSNNAYPGAAMAVMRDAFVDHPSLKHLELSMLAEDEAWSALGSLLSRTQITRLELEEKPNSATTCSVDAISALKHAKHLAQLVVDIEFEDRDKLLAFVDSLRELPTLTYLAGLHVNVEDTSGRDIEKEVAERLVKTTVREYADLDSAVLRWLLSFNAITSLTMEAGYRFEERLQNLQNYVSSSLTTLCVFSGELNKVAIPLLVDVAAKTPSFRILDVKLVTNLALAKTLVKACNAIGHLHELRLSTSFSDSEAAALEKVKTGNYVLTLNT